MRKRRSDFGPACASASVTTAAPGDDFVVDAAGVEAQGAPEEDVEVFEGDGVEVGRLQRS